MKFLNIYTFVFVISLFVSSVFPSGPRPEGEEIQPTVVRGRASHINQLRQRKLMLPVAREGSLEPIVTGVTKLPRRPSKAVSWSGRVVFVGTRPKSADAKRGSKLDDSKQEIKEIGLVDFPPIVKVSWTEPDRVPSPLELSPLDL